MGRRGFTLVEMLVVISLIVALTAFATWSSGRGNDTRYEQAAKLIASLERKAMELGTADAFSSAHVHFYIDPKVDEMAFLSNLESISNFSFYGNKPTGELSIHPFYRPYKGANEFDMPLNSYPYNKGASPGPGYSTEPNCNAHAHDAVPPMVLPEKIGLDMGSPYVKSTFVDTTGQAFYKMGVQKFDEQYLFLVPPPVPPVEKQPPPFVPVKPLPFLPKPFNGDPDGCGMPDDILNNDTKEPGGDGKYDKSPPGSPPPIPSIPTPPPTPTTPPTPPPPTQPPYPTMPQPPSMPPQPSEPVYYGYPAQPTVKLPQPPNIETFLRAGLDAQTARNVYDIMYEQWRIQCDGLNNKYLADYQKWEAKKIEIDNINQQAKEKYEQDLANATAAYYQSQEYKAYESNVAKWELEKQTLDRQYQTSYTQWQQDRQDPTSPFNQQWGTTPESNSPYYRENIAPGCPYQQAWSTDPEVGSTYYNTYLSPTCPFQKEWSTDPKVNSTYYQNWLAPTAPYFNWKVNNDKFVAAKDKDVAVQQAEYDANVKVIEDENNAAKDKYNNELAIYTAAWLAYQQDKKAWDIEKDRAKADFIIKYGDIFKKKNVADSSPWFFGWTGFKTPNIDTQLLCAQPSDEYIGTTADGKQIPSAKNATTMAKFMTYRGGEDLKCVKRRNADIVITDNPTSPAYGKKKYIVHCDAVANSVWVCKWIMNKNTGRNQCECGRIKE